MSELNQPEQGVAELGTVVASVPNFFLISKSMMLAQVYLRVGRAGDALVHLGEELARIEQSGAGLESAELYRLIGEATLMRDYSAIAEAEASLRVASDGQLAEVVLRVHRPRIL